MHSKQRSRTNASPKHNPIPTRMERVSTVITRADLAKRVKEELTGDEEGRTVR